MKRYSKRYLSGAIVLSVAIFCAPASHADWKTALRDSSLFAAGIVASLVVHEAGHALAAHSRGERLDWNGSEWSCRSPCQNIEQVSLAGNLSTAIVGEALLRLPMDYRHTPFVDGMQVYNAVNPIAYAVKSARQDGGYRDYRNVNESMQVALAIHAASVGYRQFSKRLWAVSVVPHGVQFKARF